MDTPTNCTRCGAVIPSMTATYKQWLATIQSGWAPSMVLGNGRLMSGVAATSLEKSSK